MCVAALLSAPKRAHEAVQVAYYVRILEGVKPETDVLLQASSVRAAQPGTAVEVRAVALLELRDEDAVAPLRSLTLHGRHSCRPAASAAPAACPSAAAAPPPRPPPAAQRSTAAQPNAAAVAAQQAQATQLNLWQLLQLEPGPGKALAKLECCATRLGGPWSVWRRSTSRSQALRWRR